MRAGIAPVLLAAAVLVIAGCATGPRFDTDRFEDGITPSEASRSPDAAAGREVMWGGLIVEARNLEEGSEIEVLGYPLDRAQRPDTSRPPIGRFLAVTEQYLETVDYSAGRLITVAGPFDGTQEGRIGAARYVYPVVEATPQQLHLWPVSRGDSASRFSIGVGVMLGR